MSINNSIFIFSSLIHLLLLGYLLRAFGRGKWLLVVLPWFGLMSLARILYPHLGLGSPLQRIFAWTESLWLPFAALCAVLLILGSLLGLVRSLLSGKNKTRSPKRGFLWAAGLSLLFCLYCLVEANLVLTVRHLSVETDKLPRQAEAVRVVFATDIHLNDWLGPWHLERITRKIQAQAPDIIILGGDILDGEWNPTPPTRQRELELLRGLDAPGGKFAVLGNHEVFYGITPAATFLESAGFALLRQDSVFTRGIRLAGVDDPNAGRRIPAPASNPLPLLNRINQDQFILLVKHRPSAIPESIGLFDFQLSGHTHGGQAWPIRHLINLYNDSQPGLSTHFGRGKVSQVYISNGLGFSKAPLRFLTPPEIVVLDILPHN